MTKRKVSTKPRNTKRTPTKPAETHVGRAEAIDAVIAHVSRRHGEADPEGAAFLLRFEAKRLLRAAEAFDKKPEPTNDSLRQAHKAFDGEERVDPEATVGDLVRLLFEAPNRSGETFLTDFLLCQADEAALLAVCSTNDDGMLSEVMHRVAFRMEWRAKVVLELDKRMQAAERAASGGAS